METKPLLGSIPTWSSKVDFKIFQTMEWTITCMWHSEPRLHAVMGETVESVLTGLKDSSAINAKCCSCKRAEFSSEHPHGRSQLSLTPVLRERILRESKQKTHTH